MGATPKQATLALYRRTVATATNLPGAPRLASLTRVSPPSPQALFQNRNGPRRGAF